MGNTKGLEAQISQLVITDEFSERLIAKWDDERFVLIQKKKLTGEEAECIIMNHKEVDSVKYATELWEKGEQNV